MTTSRAKLKNWFSRGKKPSGEQFSEMIDSFWHKDEMVNTGIVKTYDSKAAMLADAEPVSDVTGEALIINEMVVISNPYNISDTDNGTLWGWKGVIDNVPTWTYLGTVDNMQAMEFTNDFFDL